MKHIKKTLAVLLALILGMGLGVPAAAEEPDPSVPVITVQPVGVGVLLGEDFTLSVQAHIPNGETVGYQWHIANPFNIDIKDATGPELTLKAEFTVNNTLVGTYYCIVYNADKGLAAGSVLSERVDVTKRPLSAEELPVITKQPQNVAAKTGETFTLSVQAHIPNGDELGYQWYNANTYYGRIDGETGPIFTRTLNQYTPGSYYCVVYNKDKGLNAGSVSSEVAAVSKRVLSAQETPVITLQPKGANVNTGESFTLTVQAQIPSGDPVGYIWRNLVTSTVYGEEPALTLTARQHSGGNYYCIVYNKAIGLDAGSVNSQEAIIKVTVVPPSAREQLEEFKKALNDRPPMREGMKKDPLYLINSAIETSSLVLMVCVFSVMDLFKVPPNRLESIGVRLFQGVSYVALIPALVIYILLFALPVSLIMLPFSGAL